MVILMNSLKCFFFTFLSDAFLLLAIIEYSCAPGNCQAVRLDNISSVFGCLLIVCLLFYDRQIGVAELKQISYNCDSVVNLLF